MMKKTICLVLSLILCLCVSSALAQTVTAIPSAISATTLAHQEYCALIHDYNAEANSITITLCDVEAFSAEMILSIQPGDTIVSNGISYPVATIDFSSDNNHCVINAGTYNYEDGSLTLICSQDKTKYIPISENDITNWIPALTITVAIPESLILLDGIDPSSGEILTIPTAHDAASFALMMQDEYDVGFATSNVYVLFDEMNQPIVVRRFYVPWQ